MEILQAMLVATAVLIGGVIMMTAISSAEQVREVIQRFFLFLVAIPEMARNGASTAMAGTRGVISGSAKSVGITGEHTVQRVIGGVVLTALTLISLPVSILTMMITLGGAMGEEGETILEYLPVSLETLMAIELAATVVLSGMLLMDLLNVTHTTKFFSPETLPKALKYIFISIISGLLVFSIYLFALGGSIRAAALLSDGGDVTSVETVQSGIITTPDSTDHLKIPVQEEENQDEFPEEYTSGLKMLLIGIPAVSSVSGIFGAIGLLPFLSMLSIGIIAVPLFVICGGLWIVGQLLMRYVTLFYNFALSVLDIFIGIGEWIGRAVRNFFGQGNTEADHGVEVKTTDRDNREMPVESATNNTPAPADNEVDVQNAEEHGNASGTISDEMQPSTINDKDWNPLV